MNNLSVGLNYGINNKDVVKNHPNDLLKVLEILAQKDYNDFANYETEDLPDEIPYKNAEDLYDRFESMLFEDEKDYLEELENDENEPFSLRNDVYDHYYTGGEPLSINDLYKQMNTIMEDNLNNRENVYNQYLNQPTTMDRKGFLKQFQDHYGESFKDYLFRNNNKLSLEDIEAIEDSEMDALLEILYGTSM